MELFRQLASVCAVLGLAVFAAWRFRKGAPAAVLRRWAPSGSAKRILLVQRLPLTPQHWLCLVRVDGREWMVGVHPNGMTLMQEGSDPIPQARVPDRKESAT